MLTHYIYCIHRHHEVHGSKGKSEKELVMAILKVLSTLAQGRRKIFNLWVPSGKAEDQKKKKKERSQADSNG